MVLRDQKGEIEDLIAQCDLYDVNGRQCFKSSDLTKANESSPNPLSRSTLYDRLKEAGYEQVKRGFWGKIEED